jgi:hypothetical protein
MEVLHEVMDSNFIFSKVYRAFPECMDNYIQDIRNNKKCFRNYENCKDTLVCIDDVIKGSRN